MTDASREAIAAVQHEIWSHWMEYMFRVCKQNDDGSMTIPADKVSRWTRQAQTHYAYLTELEQESDRHQADKVLRVLQEVTHD